MDIIIPKKRPIGIFDSGVGGLTVLQELKSQLPHEDFIYYADTANVPYGNKTVEQVIYYSDLAVQWMIKHHDVKIVIIACHTSSACCADVLQKKYTVPILGTIQATVSAVLHSAPASVGLLGTIRTVEKRVHENALRDAGYDKLFIAQPCPDFVPFIEQGILYGTEIEKCITEYCANLPVSSLVYGCTHYPFIEEAIKKIVGSQIVLINPAMYIAAQLKTIVGHSIQITKIGSVQFHVTGDGEQFFITMKKLIKK
jgi:glutamate racemase